MASKSANSAKTYATESSTLLHLPKREVLLMLNECKRLLESSSEKRITKELAVELMLALDQWEDGTKCEPD